MTDRSVSISMTFSDPNPGFQVTVYLQVEYLLGTGLPRWLSGLRHSAHRPERSAGGAGFNPRVGRQISCSDFRGACFEINISGRQRGFDGVLYNV